MGSAFSHSFSPAAGAKSSPFTAKCQKFFLSAGLALEPQETAFPAVSRSTKVNHSESLKNCSKATHQIGCAVIFRVKEF